VTGFEFHLTLRPVKQINHLRMQIAAKRGKTRQILRKSATSRNQESDKEGA
jgi:hypothetical protein